jgi:hypothetical protein
MGTARQSAANSLTALRKQRNHGDTLYICFECGCRGASLNKVTFIRAIAEQAGGCHEDWEIDEILATILSSQIYLRYAKAQLHIGFSLRIRS